jgi:hypothetical protein
VRYFNGLSQVQILLPRPTKSWFHAETVPTSETALWPTMTARIYKPAKTAMQSGTAKTKEWVLDYEPEQPREIEPLMGWTSSGDMRQQVSLRFDSLDEAVAYCQRHDIVYQVSPSKPPARRVMSYADNFAFNRRDPWTH